MTYKFHLFAMVGVVGSVLLFWHFFKPPPPVIEAPVVDTSGVSISIVRAAISNCRSEEEFSPNVTADSALKEKIEGLCNGKKECSIVVDAVFASENLSENCNKKSLMVEYRCFAFDRLQSVKAASGILLVKCQPTNPTQP